jgi:hypothetical protein
MTTANARVELKPRERSNVQTRCPVEDSIAAATLYVTRVSFPELPHSRPRFPLKKNLIQRH